MTQKITSNLLKEVDVMILCGGLGTRLRSVVADRPKPMAEVSNKPFLGIIVDDLLRQGFKRIIFCTGYLGEQIENYFKRGNSAENHNFIFSKEETSLGTGGAIKLAMPFLRSKTFLVMNGDTAVKLNYEDFYSYHLEKQALLSIAVVERHFANGQGNITLAENNVISSFVEHLSGPLEGHASSGCYLMSEDIKKFFPNQDKFSLEVDVFPRLANKSHGFVLNGKFLDIGTPDRYSKAGEFFA